MPAQVLTIDDLDDFKRELFDELNKLISEKINGVPTGEWLKTNEARKLLRLSQGSLQNLRIHGHLPFSKVGGIIYYKLSDIHELLLNSRQVGSRSPFSLEKRAKQNLKSA